MQILSYPDRFWFALQVKPRHEKTVATVLNNKGLEEFLPLYTAQRRWSDRIKELAMPLFAGYVFCRFDLCERLKILTTPGVLSIVGLGKTPVPVPDPEISALQAVVKTGLPAQPWPFLRIGQAVCVEAGPLCGVEGIIVNVKNSQRLIVSVTLLQRSIAVEVDRLWLSPVSAAGGRSPAFVAA